MKKQILLFLTIAMSIAGCSKIDLDSIGEQSVGTSLATPIGTINASIFDIYKKFDTIIDLQYDQDNTVFLYWEQPLKIDKFDIKDFSCGEKLSATYKLDEIIGSSVPDGMSIPLVKGTYVIKDTLNYSFNFNELDATQRYAIDSILIRHALLEMTLNATDITLDENTYIEAELSFPGMKGQNPIVIKAIAAQNFIEIERNLGYFMASFNNSGTNDVEIQIAFKLVSDGTKTISSTSAISFSTEIKDIKYDILYGYVYSSNPISTNHTVIKLANTDQLYEFVNKNIVSLYNPELTISLTNNIGVDAYLKVNDVYALTRTGKKTNALFRGEPSFTKTVETSQRPYESATASIKLDRNFGGLNELFKEIPDSLILNWEMYIGNEEEEHNDFIIDPIQLDAKFSTRVPIWFDKGATITFEDSLEADLTAINGEWTDYVDMQKFEIFLNFENTLPVHAKARIAFLDSIGNELFAKEDFDIECPPVDELGRSEEAAIKEITLEFTEEAIGNILKTKKIALKYLIDGYDEESTINFHASDGINVKISAYATIAVTTKKKK